LLLVSLLLLHYDYCALAILWTVVPPSTNPHSKVNRDFLFDLEDTVANVQNVQDGRVWFETSSVEIFCPRNLKARSIRLVALESHNSDILMENETSIILSLFRDDWKERMDSTLDIWNRSGNKKVQTADGGDVSFIVTCQKWNSFKFPRLSSTRLCQEMSDVLIQQFGWNRVMNKKTNNITYHFHLLLYESSAILELVAFVAPPKTFLNLPKPGFRRLESFVVAKAANIKTDDVVLDPMCGKGTFLIEAWTHWPTAKIYHGIDISEEQLQDASENCQAAFTTMIHLTLGNACNLQCFPDGTVDKIITCPPFDRQFAETVPPNQLLREWSRVLKSDTGRIVLLLNTTTAEEWTRAVMPPCHIEIIRPSFPLGPNLRVSLIVISKQSTKPPKNQQFLPPKQELFDWELGTKQKGRTLWAKLRSQSLPSLIPYSEGQEGS